MNITWWHRFSAPTTFAQRAAPQLLRWESRYGWTSHGWGQVPEKGHRALGGPDRMFLQARLARQRGDTTAARKHIADCLRELPGEQDFARFAAEIGTG